MSEHTAEEDALIAHQSIREDVAMRGVTCACGWPDDDWKRTERQWAEHALTRVIPPGSGGDQ